MDAAAVARYSGTPQYANQGVLISPQLITANGSTTYASGTTSNWSSANWSSAN